VEWMLLRLHENAEDEVSIVPLWVFIHHAVIRAVLAVIKALGAAQGERNAGQVDHRHDRLLCLRHQRKTTNLPVERVLLRLHKDTEDEVPIVPLRILVDRAIVRTVLAIVKTF